MFFGQGNCFKGEKNQPHPPQGAALPKGFLKNRRKSMVEEQKRGWRIKEATNKWTHGEDWQTWVAHSVIAVLIAAVVGAIAWSLGHQGEWYGAIAAISYYLIRELEQTFYSWVAHKEIDWFDNVMDVLVPTVVVLIIAGVLRLVV
jgi:hypothetical protein